jgi:hypothetical protein
MSAHGVARPRTDVAPGDYERRLRSAVADVMDGDVAIYAASRNRGVPQDNLRAALEAAGWNPATLRGRKTR